MAENDMTDQPVQQGFLPEGFLPEDIEFIWPVKENANGGLTMYAGVTIGETERERSEEAMAELARAFAAMIDDYPAGLSIDARPVLPNPQGFTHSLKVRGEVWKGPTDWLVKIAMPCEDESPSV